MKFILSLIFITLLCVSILWYLVSSGNFLPINESGNYEWINILFFIFLTFASLASFITLISYLVNAFILKRGEEFPIYANSIKWGILFSFGILLIVVLNFFHVLNILWGIGILLVLAILSFVI